MRAGAGCSIHQSLTPSAAAIVKQSITLARRRGHAQVTPLHVATTMLTSSSGLLRSACLKSHSHPLQCKALDLCFNVALNRLPTFSTGPHHHCHPPSLSNALIAAFKRAQAHQRRGCLESQQQQQQPLLAVKIELEHLVISILDDPSVSRVMREASFSSTQVKANVLTVVPTQPPPPSDDVAVLECIIAGGMKRSLVVVTESLGSSENLVKKLENHFQLVTLPLFLFRSMAKEEVERKVNELRRVVRSSVIYLGDLSWAAEYYMESGKTKGHYCPVEHAVTEIRELVDDVGEGPTRFWVIGIATYQTYMKCRVGSPSLESVLGLHALTIPSSTSSAGPELSLNSYRYI